MKFSTLISAKELERHLHDPNWVIADCRFDLADTNKGRREYLEAHIPGAVYAHMDDDLSGRILTGVTGRHPLPKIERVVEVFSRWGITKGVQVVVYDAAGGSLAAGRLWWMLRWLGHDAAVVLDGGWTKWEADRMPKSSGDDKNQPGIFRPEPRPEMVVSVEEVEVMHTEGSYRILDARAYERYLGVVEPIDPVAGHIPGAVSAPYLENLTDEGIFHCPEELRKRFENLLGNARPEDTAHYCGSGVTSIHNLLAMELAGLNGSKLYAGSWSEWVASPGRPVAVGSE